MKFFLRPLILSAFLSIFCPIAALTQQASQHVFESRMTAVIDTVDSFVAQLEQNGLASSMFRGRISEILNTAEEQCPPDFAALLSELQIVSLEIEQAKVDLEKVLSQKKPLDKKLETAVEKNKIELADKIQDQIAPLNEAIYRLEPIAFQIHDDWLEKFKDIYSPYIGEECMDGMIYVEGTYCIDKYEYPNKEGELPMTGIDIIGAQTLCAQQNKRLCSGREWLRSCTGPACKPNFTTMRPFNPAACNAGFERRPAGSTPTASGQTPACDTSETVSEIMGNLWEWTSDTYRDNFNVVQGGVHTSARAAICSNSTWLNPAYQKPYIGFRCCTDPGVLPPAPPPVEMSTQTENPEATGDSATEDTTPETATGTQEMPLAE